MNKPKLNEPDVESTLTTFNSDTGESITIKQTIPSKRFKFVTGMIVIEQIPTEEEIIKEWEALGYEFIFTNGDGYDDDDELIFLDKVNREIYIWKDKTYSFDNDTQTLTFQEHQLLTKTFKWLGWDKEDNND